MRYVSQSRPHLSDVSALSVQLKLFNKAHQFGSSMQCCLLFYTHDTTGVKHLTGLGFFLIRALLSTMAANHKFC